MPIVTLRRRGAKPVPAIREHEPPAVGLTDELEAAERAVDLAEREVVAALIFLDGLRRESCPTNRRRRRDRGGGMAARCTAGAAMRENPLCGADRGPRRRHRARVGAANLGAREAMPGHRLAVCADMTVQAIVTKYISAQQTAAAGETKATKMNSEYSICWHKDGHSEKLIAGNLSRTEAQHRLEQLSVQCGQPILPDLIVNESDEDGCGYYYLVCDVI